MRNDPVLRHLATARWIVDELEAVNRDRPEPDGQLSWRLVRVLEALAAAAGNRLHQVLTAAFAVLVLGAVWLVATLTGPVLGWPAGWTIAISGLAVFGLCFPAWTYRPRLVRRFGRWRLSRVGIDWYQFGRPELAGDGTAGDGVEIEVDAVEALRRGHQELTAAITLAAGGRDAADFARQARFDGRMHWMSLADRSCCQAIRWLETWRPDR